MGDFDIDPNLVFIGPDIQLKLPYYFPSNIEIDFNLVIFDDDILEDDEVFTVSIVDDPLFTTGTPSSVVFTITDDDGEPF